MDTLADHRDSTLSMTTPPESTTTTPPPPNTPRRKVTARLKSTGHRAPRYRTVPQRAGIKSTTYRGRLTTPTPVFVRQYKRTHRVEGKKKSTKKSISLLATTPDNSSTSNTACTAQSRRLSSGKIETTSLDHVKKHE